VSADLTGYLEHTGDLPQAWNWTGELSALEIALSGQDTIRLQEPTGVQACPDSLRLDTACLAGTRGATACVEADWSSSAGVKAMAEARQWPLDVIGEMLGLELRISQQANGTVKMSFPQSGKPSGSADFRITAGAVGYTDDPEPILETGEGALAFTLTNGRLTSGVIDIPITGQGVIDVDFDITDVTMGLDSNLRGTLLIDLADLDILSAVLPKVDRVSGTLKTDLEISGTLGQPYFNGRFNLKDGMFENRISGLKLEAIELAGNLAENRKTRLTGSFRAAEGVGKLDALIDLRDIQQPWFKLDVVGEQLKLFNSEDLTVVVDPDFSVALQPGSVTIEGEILIPSALIAPTVIPEQTVGESPDLVITAGRPEGEEVEPEESQPISVLGGLRLALGNDVKLDLGVAELDLTGRVDFGWQGEVIPMANGRFNLSGEILAFGQLLEIARGDIGFPGVPADNPHLNIRAEREIYGNSEVRRAGLLIGGTVRRPVVEPYTDPMTNRDRAQTLLVTGSDFNMERGVGAVDIGTYIAPRIFVSYGVGVFDDENVVSIRYDLGSGWGVKATSGERQTGVDISFTVDN
jgi:translocation and assembly module TamB